MHIDGLDLLEYCRVPSSEVVFVTMFVLLLCHCWRKQSYLLNRFCVIPEGKSASVLSPKKGHSMDKN